VSVPPSSSPWAIGVRDSGGRRASKADRVAERALRTELTAALAVAETAQAGSIDLQRVVRTLEQNQVRGYLTQALEIEAVGGLYWPETNRRRTALSVFLQVVREQTPAHQH
jgi:hypothetical protein